MREKTIKKLIRMAGEARKKAYAPYSKLRVGAALETIDGKIYTGCNIENASYGLTVCAERVALSKAVSEGAKKFKRIVIAVDKKEPLPPCGACRQVLYEFSPNMEIIMVSKGGGPKSAPLKSLLPKAFVLKQHFKKSGKFISTRP